MSFSGTQAKVITVTARLYRYAVAIHVALLAGYLAWARGGSTPGLMWPVIWLSLGIIEMTLLLPPMRRTETPLAARARLRRALLRDPVVYLGLALLLFLTMQWLNGPCKLAYQTDRSLWAYTPPPWPGFPFCVDQGEARHVLQWGVALFAVLVGVRHGLNRSGKLLLLRLLVANGAVLAILGLAQFATGTSKLFWVRPIEVFFFSTFGYPNHAAAYFTLLFVINGGLLLQALADEELQRDALWLGITLVLNLMGATFSLSRAGILLAWGVLLVGAVYGSIYLWSRITLARRVQLFSALGATLALAVFCFLAMPNNPVRREAGTIEFRRMVTQLMGDRAQLAQAALQIWQDYPWVGVGGWGFRRQVALYVGQDRWDFLRSAGRANVHNDFIQFLCEHGMIGLGMMLALIAVLLVTLWIRLIRLPPPPPNDPDQDRSWFMRVSPLVWAILAGTFATVVHSLIDLPFRSAAILVLWFICLASAPAFVPRRKPAARGQKNPVSAPPAKLS